MATSQWPKGALTGTPIKRDIPNESALSFAQRAFDESDESGWQTVTRLRRWFEDEWDGGGVTLENWDEAAAVAILLFEEDDDER